MSKKAGAEPPGAGSFGGGRGTDYPPSSHGDRLSNGDSADARGKPEPGQAKIGWGGPGENYPATQGPLVERMRRKKKPAD